GLAAAQDAARRRPHPAARPRHPGHAVARHQQPGQRAARDGGRPLGPAPGVGAVRELVEGAVALVHAVRIADPAQWLLRLLALAALVGAGALCAVWVGGPLVSALLVAIVALGLWAVAAP